MQRGKIFLIVLCVMGVFFLGTARADLFEIQTAVIEQDYARAATLAQQMIDSNPSSPQRLEAEYFLGLSRINQGDAAAAKEIFEGILKQNPPENLRERATLGVIDSLMLEGSYETALQMAQKLLQTSPKSEYLSLIYYKIARAHFKLTHWEEATRTLKYLIEHFPESPENHLSRQLLSEKHYFAVQVGSFRDRDLAERMVVDLRTKYPYAYIVETVDKAGQKFYRVRIGQFSLLEEALSMARRLSELGYPTLIYP